MKPSPAGGESSDFSAFLHGHVMPRPGTGLHISPPRAATDLHKTSHVHKAHAEPQQTRPLCPCLSLLGSGGRTLCCLRTLNSSGFTSRVLIWRTSQKWKWVWGGGGISLRCAESVVSWWEVVRWPVALSVCLSVWARSQQHRDSPGPGWQEVDRQTDRQGAFCCQILPGITFSSCRLWWELGGRECIVCGVSISHWMWRRYKIHIIMLLKTWSEPVLQNVFHDIFFSFKYVHIWSKYILFYHKSSNFTLFVCYGRKLDLNWILKLCICMYICIFTFDQ